MSNVLTCLKVSKTYPDTHHPITVLREITLTIQAGEKIAIMGPSGSGKSTLLHLLGGLDFATEGDVTLLGHAWRDLSEAMRCRLRCESLGFVYQFHYLLTEFSALENVAMPLWLQGVSRQEAMLRATTVLEKVGLAERVSHKPHQLSGGERQRVAIARAVVHGPKLLLTDEPTGNLDEATALSVFELMTTLSTHQHTAWVLVTHDPRLASKMDRIFVLKQGQLLPQHEENCSSISSP